ncbi:MAG: hypothetical protein HOQ10_06900 [Frateuria sp.]|nr:hypothetical protein [Frateuria sp.]
MASKKSPPDPFAPRYAGDRATAPGALEDLGETAWQRFEELRQRSDRQFAPTQPARRGPPSGSQAFQPTQPMTQPPGGEPARKVARRKAPLSLDDVMLVARRNNRACPMPAQWQALHELLAAQQQQGPAVPVPIDGPAWDVVSPMQKRLRLRDQLEWAERAGALAAVHAFLVALAEEDWLHF